MAPRLPRALVAASLGAAAMTLSGCSSRRSCAILESLDRQADHAAKFCSPETRQALQTARVKRSRVPAYRAGQSAQAVHTAICGTHAPPVVFDVMGLGSNPRRCKKARAAVWATCFAQQGTVSNVSVGGSGWSDFIEDEWRRSGVIAESSHLQEVHAVPNATLVSETSRPLARILNSTSWPSCDYANMGACGGDCCCDAGYFYNYSAGRCQEPTSGCPVGVLYTASGDDTIQNIIESFVGMSADVDIYSVTPAADLASQGWQSLLAGLGESCAAGHAPRTYAMYDDGAGSQARACIINIAVTERLGEIAQGERCNWLCS